MKKLGFILCTFFIVFASCNNDDEPTKEQDLVELQKQQTELFTLAERDSHSCTNPDEWAFVNIGTLCGDIPIIYSKKINTTAFLNKVQSYNKFFEKYKKKWGTNNCAFYSVIAPMPPIGIKCVDNKPQFIYKEIEK